PPSVLIDESLPALAHRVTVLGSTRNMAATSAGVSSFSPSSALFTANLLPGGSTADLGILTEWRHIGHSQFGRFSTEYPHAPRASQGISQFRDSRLRASDQRAETA